MSQPGQFQNSSHRAAGKPERLLRASVTAFCAITRPTRRETAQLDDLAVPLLGLVSDECLRYVAAALSELPLAPPVLVRRLADQPVDISAPLLMRSPVLTGIDLVALIGRHGAPHARAIASRPDLDERIMRLIRSIGALDEAATSPLETALQDAEPDPLPSAAAPAGQDLPAGDAPAEQAAPAADLAEEARNRLRAMMRPAGDAAPSLGEPAARPHGQAGGVYRRLRSTALAGVPGLFHTALADALGIGFVDARDIAEADDPHDLMVALKSLRLSEEEAFLVIQCVWPGRQRGQARAVGAFVEAYEEITPQDADRFFGEWRGEAGAEAAREPAAPADGPANEPGRSGFLRAS